MAGDELEAVAGDPEVELLPKLRYARDVKQRRNGPKQRQPPGHPA